MPEPAAPLGPGNSHKLGSARRASTRRGWRRLLPIAIERTAVGTRIRVRWSRLLAALAVCAVLGYAALATGAYLFVKYQRGFAEVRLLDILLPTRWSDYRVARGNHHIRNAQEQLQAGRYREAYQSLRIGLAKAPGNRDGRLLLAQFLAGARRSDLAQRTLLDGVSHHRNDPDYLKAVFSFLLQHQKDAEAISLGQGLLADDSASSDRQRLAALAVATASFFRGNYDLAEDYLQKHGLEHVRDGRLLAARIQWERGHRELALQRVRALAETFSGDEEIYATLIGWLREAGRDAEARRVSLVRQLEFPQNVRPRIDLLHAYQKDGDIARARDATEELLRDFGHDQGALLALAEFAANTGNPALARRIHDRLHARNLDADGAALMMVEACIVAKEYRTALDTIRDLLGENPGQARRFASVLAGLQAIAFYGLGDAESAQPHLNQFLSQPSLRVENLIAVSNRLLAVGARAPARQVLAQASAADSRNQAALTSLIKLDLETGNTDSLPANVRRLLTMRKPSQEVLRAAYRKLGSDLFLFSPDRTALLDELREALPMEVAAQTRS